MGVLFKADQPAVRGYDRAMPGQANMRDTVAGVETVDRNLKIAVAIATSGRRDVLTQTILFLNRQTLKPDELLVCPAKPADVDLEGIAAYDGEVRVISGPVGLPHQRNALMAASDADIMLFLDDDFLPAPNYLEELKQLLCDDPTIVVATGFVVRDGAQGIGLGYEESVDILAKDVYRKPKNVRPTFNAYGCNMCIRLTTARRHGVRFDENLPLYAWLEDVDFSRELAAYGRVVKASHLRGVHMGTKVGRTPGKRLGYSQVANRIYLKRKGNISWLQAWDGILHNVGANLFKSLRPEPWVDRRGRLAGNMAAFKDLLQGTLVPGKILDM